MGSFSVQDPSESVQAVDHENGEIWRWIADFGQQLHILWSQCSSFSVWFLQLTAWIFNYLIAGHMTESGSLLPTRVL